MPDTDYTHGTHCVHLADWCELEGQLCRTRTLLKDAVLLLDDMQHAVDHAQDPETMHNLLGQLQNRLRRGAASITTTLDAARA